MAVGRVVSWRRFGRQGAGLVPGTLRPADVASLYGLDAFARNGIHGEGQTIAFVEFAAPQAADDAAFWQTHSLAPELNRPAGIVHVDRSPSDPMALDETDLDLQYAGALAPAARLTAYVVSDQTDVGGFLGALYDALARIAADGTRIVSISLGTGERVFSAAQGIVAPALGRFWQDAPAYAADLDALIRDGGLLVFVAAGDAGAYAGLPFGDHTPQPSWPATQPAVLAVGGTQLQLPGDLSSGEQAWGGQSLDPFSPGYTPANTLPLASGGGGLSAVFPAPARQACLGLGLRGTPDLAAFAGPLLVVSGGQETSVWGTSAAAPIAAAAAALIAQAAGALPTADQLCAAAHDIASGNNWNNTLLLNGLTTFFAAGPGYDLCTGNGRLALGTP
jgi:kumamolisin